MFKRFAALLIVFFLCSLTTLILLWQDVPSLELYSNTPVTKVDRISQDLGGKWNSYSSLREAWTRENIVSPEGSDQVLTGLIQMDSFVLPSNEGFRVAAKRFSVTGKWGFKSAQLVLEGVYGKTRVFLNGIDEVNYLGEFQGNGGIYHLDIPPTRLDFSRENTLYLEISPSDVRHSMLLGWLWPEQGKIAGQIRLEAVPETIIGLDKTTLEYKPAEKQVVVNVNLTHLQSLEHGPWALTGLIKDKDQKIAECLLPINSNGQYEQEVALIFTLPEAKLWNIEDPFLYELEITITNNRGDYDRIQIPMGIRKATGSDAQWVINDKPINVQGEILTQEQEYLIRNQRQAEDYLRKIKSKGVNVLYFMGFFPSEGWLYAADQLGIGIWLDMPVNITAKGNIPQLSSLEDLVKISERHPSVMAWTAGKGLEESQEANDYLEEIRTRIPGLPVYHLLLPGPESTAGPGEVVLQEEGLYGEWGKAEYRSPSEAVTDLGWAAEKTAAAAWLVMLFFITIANVRSPNWSYQELFNLKPKRAVRRAFFFGCLKLVSRMITLGAIFTSLLYRLPLHVWPWLPYDNSAIISVRNQNPLLIWLFISSVLIIIRLLQVGLAAPSFPQSPGALALGCWLERRYVGIIIVGIAWLATGFDMPWYVFPFSYIVLKLFFLPVRIRDVWKIKGRYSLFYILPVSIIVVAAGNLLWHYADFAYLVKVVPSLIHIDMPSLEDFQLFLKNE